MADDLALMRASLLKGRRVDGALGPGDGDEAFERHMLLATRIHRAAGLAQRGDGQGEGWVQYFVNYFPPRRSLADDARLLWNEWRTPLLKHETPGHGVSMTHGQPFVHWQRDQETGDLCINLESMWG